MKKLKFGSKAKLVVFWVMALSPLMMVVGAPRIAAVLSYYYSVNGNVTYANFCKAVAGVLGGFLFSVISPALPTLFWVLVTLGPSAFAAMAAGIVAALGPWAWLLLGVFVAAI